MLLAAAAIVGAAVIAAGLLVAARLPGAASPDAARARQLQLLALFAPGVAAAADDPRALLVWHPLAEIARRLFPDEFAALDRAAGAPFPFGRDELEAAHARWSADWLAWERTHDAEYKLKAAAADDELRASGASAVLKARAESVEREKLERYQRRYEEYTRVSKALKTVMGKIGRA